MTVLHFQFARRLWSLVYPCVFILPLSAGTAFASLYPTKPISTTVFSAGRPAQLKWVEDGHRPILGDLGHMKIHLLAGNNTYLSTLAQDVNPLLLSLTVYIPQIIPANYHLYSLRFVPSHAPHQPIYTAPFTILPNPFSYLLASSHPPASTATPVSAPSSEIPNPDLTTVSRITGTQPASPSASVKYIPTQQDSGSSFGRTGWQPGRTFKDPTVGRPVARRVTWHLDMEQMKFRLVVLVWPTLIGLSLSL